MKKLAIIGGILAFGLPVVASQSAEPSVTPATPAAPHGEVAPAGAAPAAAKPAALPEPGSFAICSGCHETDGSHPATVGPNLAGVGNRKAGTSAGYAYSPEMVASNIVWTRENLIKFVQSPQDTVPGSKMNYATPEPETAAEIADYLMSL